MASYQHILVGLDLSEDSEAVLVKAQEIANRNQAQISVLHVVEPIAFAYGGDVPIDLSEAQRLMQESAIQHLGKIAEKHGIAQESVSVQIGHASHLLHDLAKEKRADLIVVGSHGRHGWALLFGSTANGVVKGAECDVLAVRV